MKKFAILMAASVFTMSGIAAHAQTTPSTSEQGAKPAGKAAPDKTGQSGKMTPGSTGAMDNAVGGTATSPQDVQRQNQGKATAADGGGQTGAAPDASKASPGTVGATPGSDAPKPKP